MHFFGGCHGVGQRNVVVHEIDDGCGKFTHIGFYKVRLCGNLGGQVGKVGGNDLIEVVLFEIFFKCLHSVGKKTEGAADEYASCMHFL